MGNAGGTILKRVIDSDGRLVILLDHSEQNLYEIHMELIANSGRAPHVAILGDISDEPLVNEILETYRPDTIYHAAAFKHVPLMEANRSFGITRSAPGRLQRPRYKMKSSG